jgi:hypothetical protein
MDIIFNNSQYWVAQECAIKNSALFIGTLSWSVIILPGKAAGFSNEGILKGCIP